MAKKTQSKGSNVIYGIQDNKSSKMLYIGETTREVEHRFQEHLRKLKDGWHSNLALQIAYDRCDGDVSFIVLEHVKTITEIEREWIDKTIGLCNEA